MIPDSALKNIARIVGDPFFTTHRDDLFDYASDATELTSMPDAVAHPENGEEISQILVLANEARFPVIPRGAGSGKSGGAVPINGGLVLAMDRFNRILNIDQDNLVAEVEPGVITADFQEEIEKLDLFYPPDPASIYISTIGGNVAECAGGLRAVKYGVTRDYVLGLKVVLPTGEIINTGVKTAKGVAGYDLTRLLVGSEGTLAVITAITLRLIPKPAAKKTILAYFEESSSAVKTASELIKSKIAPTTLEFMDELCIDCLRKEKGIPFPSEASALLLVEVDGDEKLVNLQAGMAETACSRLGALKCETAKGVEEAERLWEARRYVSDSIMMLGPNKISEDIVVPRSRMAEMVSFLKQLRQKYGIPIPAFGHAGDGNLHVNIMYDRAIQGQMEDAHAIVEEVFRKVVEMEGTITGEHGIGITKAPYLEMEISKPALELMSRLKKAFDPKGILNPGKIFN